MRDLFVFMIGRVRCKKMEFGSLLDYNDPNFFAALKAAEKKLIPKLASNFFRIIVDHLKSCPDDEVVDAIYSAMTKLVSKGSIMEIFARDGFLMELPFWKGAPYDLILDLLYVIIDKNPESIEKFAPQLAKIASYRGEKCLILLSRYAYHMRTLKNPWPIVDVLFIQSTRFSALDVGVSYVWLLAMLCRAFSDFMDRHAERSWEIIVAILADNDKSRLWVNCWESLSAIASVSPTFDTPWKLLKAHIGITNVRPYILSFLVVANTDGFEPDVRTLGTLLKAAKADVLGTTALMRLAGIEKVSAMLTMDMRWVDKGLPTRVETLRLVLVMNRHESLREQIGRPKDLISLFTELNKSDWESMPTVLSIVIRNMAIHQKVLRALDETGFFHAYIERASDRMVDAVMLGEAISRVAELGCLERFCDVLKRALRKEVDADFSVVCRMGSNMSRIPALRDYMIAIKIPAVLKKRMQRDGNKYLTRLHTRLTEKLRS